MNEINIPNELLYFIGAIVIYCLCSEEKFPRNIFDLIKAILFPIYSPFLIIAPILTVDTGYRKK